MYIMGCIWQALWILEENVEICFYFLIIRVVISQLALQNVVRSNPSTSPSCPHPKMTITDSYSESSYLTGLT